MTVSGDGSLRLSPHTAQIDLAFRWVASLAGVMVLVGFLSFGFLMGFPAQDGDGEMGRSFNWVAAWSAGIIAAISQVPAVLLFWVWLNMARQRDEHHRELMGALKREVAS